MSLALAAGAFLYPSFLTCFAFLVLRVPLPLFLPGCSQVRGFHPPLLALFCWFPALHFRPALSCFFLLPLSLLLSSPSHLRFTPRFFFPASLPRPLSLFLWCVLSFFVPLLLIVSFSLRSLRRPNFFRSLAFLRTA